VIEGPSVGQRAASDDRPAAAGGGAAARAREYRARGWWTGERLQDRYARAVAERPDGLAVADNRGRRFTNNELWAAAGALADRLAGRGIGAGDAVIIFLPNWVEWQVVMLAVLCRGAIPANLPIRTDAETLGYVADLVGARLVVASTRHGANETGATARAAAESRPLDVLLIDEAGAESWAAARAADEPRPSGPARPPDLDHVMFTSSTTGRPKAVMHSADTLAALNHTFTERFGLGPDKPIFMASPLGHSVGTIHGARLSLYCGAPLILQERWDPAAALAMIDEFDCAFTAAATPFLKDLVEAPWAGKRPKLAAMDWFLCGGAQVPPALMEAAAEAFPNTFVTVLWGMTEGGLTTCTRDSPPEKAQTTAGVGLPGLELRILDDQDRARPPGTEGELAMRGPGVFIGYLGQEDLYRSLLTADGFFRTGDLACLDADGYVRITGRVKDLIIRGGVNISPVPIEDALAAHPSVDAVAIVGAPDTRLGERLCAVVVPRGAPPTLEDLCRFARMRGLPKYHWPERLHLTEAMPRTPAGKIRKNVLRDRVAAAIAEGVLTVRLGDIDVAYEARGSGPAAVFIHGLAEDHHGWDAVVAALGDFRCFAYDLRGHGGTGLGAGDGTLAQLGGDLARFLEEVSGPACCVGYSLGGTVALWLAAHRPELVPHAVVAGTSTVVGKSAAQFFAERIALIQGDKAAFAEALKADTALQIASEGVDLGAVAARRLAAVGDGGGYINAARAMAKLADEPLTPLLGRVRCPVDVISGERDAFCPRKAADIIVEALAEVTYHEIAGAGHLLAVDRPDAYAVTIGHALRRRIS